MHFIGNIWRFKTRQLVVSVDAFEDDDLDLSFDDDGSVRAGLDSGEFVAFTARARVTDSMGGELATDFLGGCIYRSLAEFGSSHRDPDPMNRNCSIMRAGRNVGICHYFPDMVKTVCKEARRALLCRPKLYIRETNMTTYRVLAIAAGENWTGQAEEVGEANTKEEAVALVKRLGYPVLVEGEGGCVDCYDAEDAPSVYGIEVDGRGAISVTYTADEAR